MVSVSEGTDYFAPSTKPFMINLQVENLDEVLAQLKRENVDVDPKIGKLRLRQIWLGNGSRRKPGRILGTKLKWWPCQPQKGTKLAEPSSRGRQRRIELGGEGFEPPTLSV